MRCALIVPLGALALLTGCATPGPYRTMSVVFDEPAPATLGTDLDELHIAQVVARLLRDRLDLPFPQTTTVRVYVNQTTFAEGLVRDGSGTRPGIAHVSASRWRRPRDCFCEAISSRPCAFPNASASSPTSSPT